MQLSYPVPLFFLLAAKAQITMLDPRGGSSPIELVEDSSKVAAASPGMTLAPIEQKDMPWSADSLC
jgi:hypothetical protein